jgi:rod shape-determining protein MreD
VNANPYRLIAASTAIVTALVLQASLLSALTAPLAVSLPAVLVASIGLQAGVSAGMSTGFCAGLLADLSSRHPAGVLALCWLVLGIVCGLLADPRRRLRWSLALVGAATALVGLLASGAIATLGAGGFELGQAAAVSAPTALANAAIAIAVLGPTKAVLRRHQAPNPVRRIRWGRVSQAMTSAGDSERFEVTRRQRRLRASEAVVDA